MARPFPNLPACAEREPRWTDEIAREDPDIVVLMLGLGELFDRWVDDRVLAFGSPEFRTWLVSEVDRRRTLIEAQESAFALTTVPCMGISADAADRHAQTANDPERLGWLNGVIKDYGLAHPEVTVLDVNSELCPDGYAEQVNGVRIRDDGLHLNADGVELFWQRIGPQLVEAGANESPVLSPK